jgi:hypothetical protein
MWLDMFNILTLHEGPVVDNARLPKKLPGGSKVSNFEQLLPYGSRYLANQVQLIVERDLQG